MATSEGRLGRQRLRALPDEPEDFVEDDDPELERLDPDDRAPDDLVAEPDDDLDGARADEDDLPDDGAPRTDGERVYGDADPMLRLGRVGEVRGTMTGRDEFEDELGRPPPTRGVTGCRTRGEDEYLPVLGRDDELRAVGREDDDLVVGRFRPLEPRFPPPNTGGFRPLWLYEPLDGLTRVRPLLPEPLPMPLPEEVLPGR